MIITSRAYPRIGLIGNPSDGFFGKTISFVFHNYKAEVTLYETPRMEIIPADRDHSTFGSVTQLVSDVRQYGYYGGLRLLKATVKRFVDYCEMHGHVIHNRNFTLRYDSNIPGQVGLAGSSAIVTATLRALMQFYHVAIPKPEQANLVLSVEADELGIAAGLQDRVVQVYSGLVYMDFARRHMERYGYGLYELLPCTLLRNIYLAYRTDLAEESGVYHNDMRARFNRGDRDVLDAIDTWGELTDKVRHCLLSKQQDKVGVYLDTNFNIRRKVSQISEGNLRMVDAARSCGASAKFTGSGGAIVGTYADNNAYNKLKKRLGQLNIRVLKPKISLPSRGA
jgi:glucuronokinase